MVTGFLLLIQLVLWAGLYAIVPSPFGLMGETAFGALKMWQETTALFAIPFCLLLFCLSKNRFMRSLKLGWGLWNAILSGTLLWDTPARFPEITWMGMSLVALNGVLGLSMMIHTLMEFEKKPAPNSGSPISNRIRAPQVKNPNPPLPKVEGS